jgi:DNA polymerase-1
MNKPLLLLIDGHALTFFSHYSSFRSDLGKLKTCFTFLHAIKKILRKEKPDALAIAFDHPSPTFRHRLDSNYKANRPEHPSDVTTSLSYIKAVLSNLGVAQFIVEGYEADDAIGTLAYRSSEFGYRTKILTKDRDIFQLVNDEKDVSVLYLEPNGLRSGDFVEFSAMEVEGKMGVSPGEIIDFKALGGDSSDNYKGVQGIGEKTAAKLIRLFRSLENLYQEESGAGELLSGTQYKKLLEGRNDAFHCQKLATIKTDVPMEIDINKLRIDYNNLYVSLIKCGVKENTMDPDQLRQTIDSLVEAQ